MSDISQKSKGELIDQLITADIKCFFAQESIGDSDPVKALRAARSAQVNNKRRCDLIRALDARLGDGDISPSEKTY